MPRQLKIIVTDETGSTDIAHALWVNCALEESDLALPVRDFYARFLEPAYTKLHQTLQEGRHEKICSLFGAQSKK